MLLLLSIWFEFFDLKIFEREGLKDPSDKMSLCLGGVSENAIAYCKCNFDLFSSAKGNT